MQRTSARPAAAAPAPWVLRHQRAHLTLSRDSDATPLDEGPDRAPRQSSRVGVEQHVLVAERGIAHPSPVRPIASGCTGRPQIDLEDPTEERDVDHLPTSSPERLEASRLRLPPSRTRSWVASCTIGRKLAEGPTAGPKDLPEARGRRRGFIRRRLGWRRWSTGG